MICWLPNDPAQRVVAAANAWQDAREAHRNAYGSVWSILRNPRGWRASRRAERNALALWSVAASAYLRVALGGIGIDAALTPDRKDQDGR